MACSLIGGLIADGRKTSDIWVADPSGQYLKLLPHRHWTDGFFAAVLRRVAE